jgi:transketolase
MVHRAGASHIGSCLSLADILAHLYAYWLHLDKTKPMWAERDRVILSKGHAAAIFYAALAEKDFFPKEWLERYCADGSPLGGHITHGSVHGVEVSTGSLGHGLSLGLGMAKALHDDGSKSRVVVLLSDGECNEGSIWEAALFAPHLSLDNLFVIVDYNKIQALGRTQEVNPLEPFVAKWSAFRWSVREIDGHDHTQIYHALHAFPFEHGRPSLLLAHTVKGKGVSFMENTLLWHYRSPNQEELDKALREIDAWDRDNI